MKLNVAFRSFANAPKNGRTWVEVLHEQQPKTCKRKLKGKKREIQNGVRKFCRIFLRRSVSYFGGSNQGVEIIKNEVCRDKLVRTLIGLRA